MIASMPHFFKGDPKLLEDVEGLEPSEEKHGIYIDFEIVLIQFQLNLQKCL